MAVKTHKYRGGDLHELHQQILNDWGPDARLVRTERYRAGLGRRRLYEVHVLPPESGFSAYDSSPEAAPEERSFAQALREANRDALPEVYPLLDVQQSEQRRQRLASLEQAEEILADAEQQAQQLLEQAQTELRQAQALRAETEADALREQGLIAGQLAQREERLLRREAETEGRIKALLGDAQQEADQLLQAAQQDAVQIAERAEADAQALRAQGRSELARVQAETELQLQQAQGEVVALREQAIAEAAALQAAAQAQAEIQTREALQQAEQLNQQLLDRGGELHQHLEQLSTSLRSNARVLLEDVRRAHVALRSELPPDDTNVQPPEPGTILSA